MNEKILCFVLLFTAYSFLECKVIDLKEVVDVSQTDYVKKERAPIINGTYNTRTKRQNSDLVRIILDSSNGYAVAKTGDAGTINQGAFNGAKNSQININTVNIPHGTQKGVTVNIVNVNNAGQKDATSDKQPGINAEIPQNNTDEAVGKLVTENPGDVSNPTSQRKVIQPSNNTISEINERGQGVEDGIIFDESNNGFAIENGETANVNNDAVIFQESSNGFGSENSAGLIQTTNSNAFGQFSNKFNVVKSPNTHKGKSGSESRPSHHVSADNYWEGHHGEYEQFRKYGRHSYHGQSSDRGQHDNHGYPRDPYRFWSERSDDYFEHF